MQQHNDLRTDPIFSVTSADGPREVSLAQVLAGLGDGTIFDFSYLQPHQRQPWHSFLVQLAAMCVDRGFAAGAALTPAGWNEALLQLSGGNSNAWRFIVEDLDEPAFLQPPVPERTLDKFTSDISTPDQLDMLVTAKNHDVKMARIVHPRREHWLFALLTLQTQQGFLGAGNYGVARMNGGFGSRPLFAIDPAISWAARFTHDVRRLVEECPRLADTFGYSPTPSHYLLWLDAWSGGKDESVPLADCHPYAVEICRRIRFDARGVCYRATTKAARINIAKELKGVTGDPWTPIVRGKETKALNVGLNGFRYGLVRDILFGEEFENAPAADPAALPAGHGGWIVAQCLARGQGGTEGFHERLIPFPSRAISLFAKTDGKAELAKRSRAWIDDASLARLKVLYPALRALLTAGDGGKVESEKLHPWGRRLEAAVDDRFFPALWGSLEEDAETARTAWREWLFSIARDIFDEAARSTPYPSSRRYRAICAGGRVLGGAAKRELQITFQPKQEAPHEQ